MGFTQRKLASPRELLKLFLIDTGRPVLFQTDCLHRFSVMVMGRCLPVSVSVSTAVILCPEHSSVPVPFYMHI